MFLRRRRKIFCIGFNKTGTTSLGSALTALGFSLGDQPTAELLIHDWARRDFGRLIKYCKTADAFQDVPFSLDYTYAAVDAAFPAAKFILTVRQSADEWFDSLTRFHTKLVGKNRLPTAEDLREFPYHGAGWLWKAHCLVHDVDESSLYDRDHYVEQYEFHNRQVIDYFRHRPDDLLVMNVAEQGSMKLLCEFLDVPYTGQPMPHLNASRQAA